MHALPATSQTWIPMPTPLDYRATSGAQYRENVADEEWSHDNVVGCSEYRSRHNQSTKEHAQYADEEKHARERYPRRSEAVYPTRTSPL
eukprot:1684243-Pyramimonas_sp.AAC.1